MCFCYSGAWLGGCVVCLVLLLSINVNTLYQLTCLEMSSMCVDTCLQFGRHPRTNPRPRPIILTRCPRTLRQHSSLTPPSYFILMALPQCPCPHVNCCAPMTHTHHKRLRRRKRRRAQRATRESTRGHALLAESIHPACFCRGASPGG